MTIGPKNAQETRSAVQAAVERHGTAADALIPILNDVNREIGYLPGEVLVEIGHFLRVPSSRLLSVASFYRMLSTQPRGRHVVQFCESAPCHVVGGRKIWQALQEELGLEPGETSLDGKWTLLTTSCPGICGVGPVVKIDDDIYGNVEPARVPEILARYQ